MKKFVATLAVCAAISSPVFAEEAALTCDDGTLAKMNDKLNTVVDPALKERVDAARAELKTAEAALKANKTEDCVAALKKSLDIVPGKPTP